MTAKLSDVCTVKYGKDHKRIADGRIPVYGSGGIMRYIDTALYDKKSVLIPRKGTLDNLFFVNEPFWTVDTLFYTEIDETKVIPEYLYYFLKTRNLAGMNVGTAVPSLTVAVLNEIKIDVPSLSEQQIIADTLSALDARLAENIMINHHLEQMAHAIFKSWFVDFEPFGGEQPTNWTTGNLLDIADYLNGLAMQRFRPIDDEVGLPVLKIKELRQGFCDSSSELCSPNIRSDYIVHDGDVIFSWSGSLLVDFWCGGDCGLNQHLFKVTSTRYDKWFYYGWTRHHLAQFVAMAADKATTMGHIKREALANAEVLIPDEDGYRELGSLLAPMYEQAVACRVESRNLALLRDSLLPRLMSGELTVSEVPYE